MQHFLHCSHYAISFITSLTLTELTSRHKQSIPISRSCRYRSIRLQALEVKVTAMRTYNQHTTPQQLVPQHAPVSIFLSQYLPSRLRGSTGDIQNLCSPIQSTVQLPGHHHLADFVDSTTVFLDLIC